jgi:hypothetical protein
MLTSKRVELLERLLGAEYPATFADYSPDYPDSLPEPKKPSARRPNRPYGRIPRSIEK